MDLSIDGIKNINNIFTENTCKKIIDYVLNKDNIDFEPFSDSPYRSSITIEEITNIDTEFSNKISNVIKNELNNEFYLNNITVHFKDKWLGAEEQWHQDYYYNMITHNGKPEDFYRLFVSLDDHVKENGCMIFMNKSHNEGLLNYNSILSIHSYQKNRTKINNLDECYKKYGLTYYPLKKGNGILFNSMILHSSPSNQTNNPRRALQIQLIRKNTLVKSNDEVNKYNSERKIFEIKELEKRINNKNT